MEPYIPATIDIQNETGSEVKTGESQSESSMPKLEKCGLNYWIQQVRTAKEHGGDYQLRLDTAMRDSLGSAILCSVSPGAMEIVTFGWVANVFMHICVRDSLGASVLMVLGFGRSLLFTILISWPVGLLMAWIKQQSNGAATGLFPVITFAMTFLIMSCPLLEAQNAMVVIMYILIGFAVIDEYMWYLPLLVALVMFVGIATGPIVNILPYPRLAVHNTEHLSSNLATDLKMFLLHCKQLHHDALVQSTFPTKAAEASIHMLYGRIVQGIKDLKANLPAAQMEMNLACAGSGKFHKPKRLERWIDQMEELQPHILCLQNALTKPIVVSSFDTTSYGKSIQNVTSNAQNKAIDAMISSLNVLSSVDGAVSPDRGVMKELELSMLECHIKFRHAMMFATTSNSQLLEDNQQKQQVFANLTCQMAALNALLEIGDCLIASLKNSDPFREDEDRAKDGDKTTSRCSSQWVKFVEWVSQPWLCNEKETFRLALKTAIGMMIASLFVAVPYLKAIATPHELWPGYTIASVNLATTGSSFHKAGDRLFGTLLAGAYALLVADLFPGSPETNDWIKVPALVIFTFIMIYLRDKEHEYRYTYAANSIGSMFYGSVEVGYDLKGYIPNRIELIFVGIIIFTAVELLLFVRSSREMVERKGLSIFLSLKDFLDQTVQVSLQMECSLSEPSYPSKATNTSLQNDADCCQMQKLDASFSKLVSEIQEYKEELNPGLQEPLLGFSLPLHSPSFNGLAKEHSDCITYGTLLVKNMKTIIENIQHNRQPVQAKDWSCLQTALMSEEFQKAEICCQQLHAAFPDGCLRPQKTDNEAEAIQAAASFRGFGGDSLDTFAKWSDICSQAVRQSGSFDSSDAGLVMTLGMTTAYFLTLCHHIEMAGSHLEAMACNFPRITKKNS